MAACRPTRRLLLTGLAAVWLGGRAGTAGADEVIELGWDDLLPDGSAPLPSELRGLVEHDKSALAAQQPASGGVRTDWNGKTVRLPGYVVPLEYAGMGVTEFILVPYVGACIHVPPPPANQLVLVSTSKPFEVAELFQAVTVTGTFSTAVSETGLAEVGYALAASRVEPYR